MTVTPTEAAYLLHRLTGLMRGPGGLKWSEAKPLACLASFITKFAGYNSVPGAKQAFSKGLG